MLSSIDFTMKHTVFLLLLSYQVSHAAIFNRQFLVALIKDTFDNIVDKSIKDTRCASDLHRFTADLVKFKKWAVNMLDATGKLHPGVLRGNVYHSGSYEQCLDVKVGEEEDAISGQYCAVYLETEEKNNNQSRWDVEKIEKNLGAKTKSVGNFLKSLKVIFGICVPKSCSVAQLRRLWKDTGKFLGIPLRATFREEYCRYKDKPMVPHKTDFYIFMFFALHLAIVLASTIYDVCLKLTRKTPNKHIFVSFSLYTNSQSLLSTSTTGNLTCLSGIRVISVTWLILGHLAVVKALASNTNSFDVTEWRSRLGNTFILASPYAVDTFFTISGFLVLYSRNSYTLALYTRRFVRLVPALFVAVLLAIAVVKNITNGLMWSRFVVEFSRNCHRNWWTSLLFTNNFLSQRDQCILPSWYLAVGFQLYLLSPLIVFVSKKYPNKIFPLAATACSISFIVTVIERFGFVVFFKTTQEYPVHVYSSTLFRMPAWLVGLLYGHLLRHKNSQKIKISKTLSLLFWTLSLSLMLNVIFYHHTFITNDYTVIRSELFNTFSRTIWSFSTGLIIYLCSTGHGGFVNAFLSHPLFAVPGKLTYSMFLVHYFILYALVGNQKEAGSFGTFQILHQFCGTYVIIVACSVVINLTFEMPFLSLVDHLQRSKPSRKKS